MPYRIEASVSSRAGCANKECKDAKVKIAKGELRVGSWVESAQFQAFAWRHWGCTTPAVLANIIKEVRELTDSDDVTPDNVDGFQELPEEFKDKVRRAFENGHVDDEDWKGDVEMNRIGRRGFRLPKAKKPVDEEPTDEESVVKDEPVDDEKVPEIPKAQAKKGTKATKKAGAAAVKNEPVTDEEAPKAKGTKNAGPTPVKAPAKKRAKVTKKAEPAPVKTKAKKRARPSGTANMTDAVPQEVVKKPDGPSDRAKRYMRRNLDATTEGGSEQVERPQTPDSGNEVSGAESVDSVPRPFGRPMMRYVPSYNIAATLEEGEGTDVEDTSAYEQEDSHNGHAFQY